MQGVAITALLRPRAANAAFGLFQTGIPSNTGTTQQQNIAIGGIGLTRGTRILNDGTMLSWNDSCGPYKANTATTPGTNTAPFAEWSPLLKGGTNFPSAWLQAPTPYLGQGVYGLGAPLNNSNIIYAMIVGATGNAITNLMKSTDGGSTWALTTFPTNSLANNNGGQPKPGYYSQSIAVDPFNNSNAWCTGDSNVYATTDGGATWTVSANLTADQYFAMEYDPTTANRLVVGKFGGGVYVSTNANLGASATFTLATGSSSISPGEGKFGSDGTYYCTNPLTLGGVWRLTPAGVFSQIFTDSKTQTQTFGIDPNNPSRMMVWGPNDTAFGHGPLVVNTTACNTATPPSWTGNADKTMGSTPDSPLCGNSFALGNTSMVTGNGCWFDPWKTTSTSSVAIAGSGSISFQVASGIANITVGRQLRATNTGTSTNYMIFNVTAYSGTTLTGTIISGAQPGFLGGPSGGSGTFSAWTITAERLYANSGPGGGPTFIDGFVSGTQAIGSCTYGIEGSSIYDVVWPVGGNPVLATQDRDTFQIPTNPFGATAGVVTGYGPTIGANSEGATIAVSPSDPTFWICNGFDGFKISTNKGISGSWNAPANLPAGIGPVACANSNIFLAAGGPGGTGQTLQYTQNGGASAWSNMPSPAPGTGWSLGQPPFVQAHTLDLDTTTTGPFVFYGYNESSGAGFVYQLSVPVSGTPTVTQKAQLTSSASNQVTGQGVKLRCVPGNAGHMFWCAGQNNSGNTLATVFSNHPNSGLVTGGFTVLQFSSNQGGAFTKLSTTTQEVIAFGLGKASTGGSGYPTIGAIGWCGGGQFGFYVCKNFNPASIGSETWTLITSYVGTYGIGDTVTIEGDPNQEGRWIVGLNGNGAVIFETIGLTNGWF